MSIGYSIAVLVMLLLPAGDEKPNPWRDKVAPAVEKARQAATADAYRDALQAAWRADDWQVGLELAREAVEKHASAPQLYGPAARALWRAGYLADAESIIAKLPARTTDRAGLTMLILTNLARGEHAPAAEAADRLYALPSLTGEDLYYVLMARTAVNRLDGIGDLIRRAQKAADADNGYPEVYVAQQLEGTAEFYDAIGKDPVNQITAFGSAPMPVIGMINLPGCEVMLNGHGPYHFIVDTGGSITLSVDDEVAAEIGLKSVAQASVHGVGGKETAGQALVDELRVGDITCRRVLTRTFGVRKSVANMADGILGTGLFGDGRMTLDFETGRLIVSATTDRPGPGRAADIRIIGDAKLIALVTVQGEPAAALLDSGADAFAISPSRLKHLFPGRPIRSLPALALGVGGDRAPSISLTPGVDFELAGRKFHNFGGLSLDVLDTLLGPMLGVQSDLLAGMPVMRQTKSLTIDFPHSKMWVDWLESE